jgi:hypothetical protein
VVEVYRKKTQWTLKELLKRAERRKREKEK